MNAREARAARDQAIIEDWYENGLSYAELSAKHGPSVSMCRKLIALDKVANGERERKTTSSGNCRIGDRPLSALHAYVGHLVGQHLQKNRLTPTEFGLPLRMTRHNISAICRGSYDFTVTELQLLAKVLDTNVNALISHKEAHVAG